MKRFRCCICGKETNDFGNNPFPIAPQVNFGNMCCNRCNEYIVLPARVAILEARAEAGDINAD